LVLKYRLPSAAASATNFGWSYAPFETPQTALRFGFTEAIALAARRLSR
jgi:hypothetical protein